MSRIPKDYSKKIGLSPGTVKYIGKRKAEKVVLSVIDYSESEILEKSPETIEECFPFKDKESVTWINIDGLHDEDIIQKLGNHYDIHPLVLEDILHTEQRPKIEIYDHHIFIVLKMIYFKDEKVHSEQISLILGKNFVITFQETPGDYFDGLRERIRHAKGRIRKMKSDYLTHALLDIIIDHYFLVLEQIGEKVESFEQILLANPKPETLAQVYDLKRETLYLRRSVWPLREVIQNLERTESPLVNKKTVPYLRDLYDHTIQVIEAIETSRDLLAGMLDLYLTSISNRTNEVMKVLTIIATIFIPLTFITGVYGTNFQYLPEITWRHGYHYMWIVILLTTIGMLFFFRKKKWV